jgi:hypothetical protein
MIDWEQLVDRLDYHHRKWYENLNGRWCPIFRDRAYELIRQLVSADEVDQVIKRFAYRDSEAHARSKNEKGGMQLLLI